MFGKRRKSNIKKQVRKRYKALKKSGDVKLGKEAGLSKKEMKEGIRKNIAEKGVLRKRNVMAKKALDNIARKESSVATSKDMATERSNRSAERQAYMQSKADAANKNIKSRKAIGSENERIRANKMTANTTKPGDNYEMIMPDGTRKMVRKPNPESENMKTRKNRAMYGAKVKAVKKAKNGGKITDPPTKKKTKAGQLNPPSSSDKKMKKTVKDVPKTKNFLGLDPGPSRPSKSKTSEYIALTSNPPKYRNLKTGKVISESEYYKVTGKIKKEGGLRKLKHGGALKSVPSKAKGLSKLPKGVRNKMGYMQDGGKVKSKSFGVLKSDANKAKKAGPKLEDKPPYSKNGINYTWDRKQGVYVGDLGDNYAVKKKMKHGGKVKAMYGAKMKKKK